jgi:cell wall-associated NlpC family hydrolase
MDIRHTPSPQSSPASWRGGEREKQFEFLDLMSARYEEGGRGPDKYDCFGLFAELCRRNGMEIPEHPSPSDLRQRQSDIQIEAAAHWHRLNEPEVGCAVVIRIGPWMSHIGMVLEGGKFIHANTRTGVTVASLDDLQWRQRIAGFYRYAGVKHG